MLPLLKDLFADKENLIEITSCNKEHYQYPGYHSSNHSSVLYFTPDVTQLPTIVNLIFYVMTFSLVSQVQVKTKQLSKLIVLMKKSFIGCQNVKELRNVNNLIM